MQQCNREEIFQQVCQNVRKILRINGQEDEKKDFTIGWETDIFSDLGIDSVEIMDLVGLLESEFEISLDPQQVAGKKTINDIVDSVVEKLKSRKEK